LLRAIRFQGRNHVRRAARPAPVTARISSWRRSAGAGRAYVRLGARLVGSISSSPRAIAAAVYGPSRLIRLRVVCRAFEPRIPCRCARNPCARISGRASPRTRSSSPEHCSPKPRVRRDVTGPCDILPSWRQD
jgi:hypothetical protein